MEIESDYNWSNLYSTQLNEILSVDVLRVKSHRFINFNLKGENVCVQLKRNEFQLFVNSKIERKYKINLQTRKFSFVRHMNYFTINLQTRNSKTNIRVNYDETVWLKLLEIYKKNF